MKEKAGLENDGTVFGVFGIKSELTWVSNALRQINGPTHQTGNKIMCGWNTVNIHVNLYLLVAGEYILFYFYRHTGSCPFQSNHVASFRSLWDA